LKFSQNADNLLVSSGAQPGQTIDSLISAKRDAASAKRFFRKAQGQPHTVNPRTNAVDKNAAYPRAPNSMSSADHLRRWRSHQA
jgi:transposase-like protein